MAVFYSKELFPTRQSLAYFVLYIVLLVSQGVLVKATQTSDSKYTYNTVTVVLLTECLKLIAAVAIFLTKKSIKEFLAECIASKKVLLLYLVPAGLYCLGNNLQFVNLANYDPATYYVLLQLRVVVTGVIFQRLISVIVQHWSLTDFGQFAYTTDGCMLNETLFKKTLSGTQWLSLFCLTAGCMVKEYGRTNAGSVAPTIQGLAKLLDVRLALVLLQTACSCLAGVYNEYLLKDYGRDVSTMTQNAFMYVNSILFNVCVLGYQGQLADAFSGQSLAAICQVRVLCMIVNQALFGIVVSLFLRSLNSIVKTFASALQIMLTALLAWFIFGIALDVTTVVAIVIVSVASVMYAQNPVVKQTKID